MGGWVGYGALVGSFTAQLSCPCVELGCCLQQEPLALLWLQSRPVLAQVDEELEGMVRADRLGGDPWPVLGQRQVVGHGETAAARKRS